MMVPTGGVRDAVWDRGRGLGVECLNTTPVMEVALWALRSLDEPWRFLKQVWPLSLRSAIRVYRNMIKKSFAQILPWENPK